MAKRCSRPPDRPSPGYECLRCHRRLRGDETGTLVIDSHLSAIVAATPEATHVDNAVSRRLSSTYERVATTSRRTSSIRASSTRSTSTTAASCTSRHRCMSARSSDQLTDPRHGGPTGVHAVRLDRRLLRRHLDERPRCSRALSISARSMVASTAELGANYSPLATLDDGTQRGRARVRTCSPPTTIRTPTSTMARALPPGLGGCTYPNADNFT